MAENNEAETIATLATRAVSAPQIIKADDGREFLITPDTMKAGDISPPNTIKVLMPQVVTQHIKVQTTESLADYVNRFKNADTVLFADITNNTISAIVDYHKAAVDAPLGPQLATHRATLALPFSLEWQTWQRANGKLMSHLEFATFLEENSVDIKSPAGADLLELCRDLQVAHNVNFGSQVRMGDVTKIEYQKDNDAKTKGGVSLPTSIILSIPVYFGEQPVPMTAFMRRKIGDGALYLGVQLSRAENVRQEEFHRIVDFVQEKVALTTIYGTPA
jgi:uncharacterized protein YfdQ (DUF2303 family)